MGLVQAGPPRRGGPEDVDAHEGVRELAPARGAGGLYAHLGHLKAGGVDGWRGGGVEGGGVEGWRGGGVEGWRGGGVEGWRGGGVEGWRGDT